MRHDDNGQNGFKGVVGLRAQLRSNSPKALKEAKAAAKAAAKASAPPPPPKQSKKVQPVVDKRDEAAEKAERFAQMQHQTSLLKGRVKSLYREDKPKGGAVSLIMQVVFVFALCGGGAWVYETRAWEQVDWDSLKYQLKLDQFLS